MNQTSPPSSPRGRDAPHSIRIISDYEGLSLPAMDSLSRCFRSLAKVAKCLNYPGVVSMSLENAADSFRQAKTYFDKSSVTVSLAGKI